MGDEDPAQAERDPTGPEDALHPVRRLRREPIGRLGRVPIVPPLPPSIGPEPAPARGRPGLPRRRQRSTGRLAVGLVGAALVASAGWSVAVLRGRPAPAPRAPAAPNPPAQAQLPVGPFSAQSPPNAIGNLRMFSTRVGWAQRLGDGAILHTGSGVLRWALATPPTTGAVVAAAWVDGGTARALTVPQDVQGQTSLQSWATADGGSHWVPEGSFAVRGFAASYLGGLDFVDPEHGWYSQVEEGAGVTGTALFRTVDGGAHWRQIATTATAGSDWPAGSGVIPSGCAGLTASFATVTTGWITGTCPTGPAPLYVSHDGGLTWGDQPLGPAPSGLKGGPYGETSFPPVFTSPRDGTLLIEDVGAAPESAGLFATGDGGTSWTLRYTAVGSPLADDFLDGGTGWLVTDSLDGDAAAPDLFATTDGGQTWSVLDAFPYLGLSLDFLTPRIGWAAPDLSALGGGPSYLLQTEDGGRTWITLVPQVSAAPGLPAPAS